jgi:DNA-binding MarR family transcriptional regulator
MVVDLVAPRVTGQLPRQQRRVLEWLLSQPFGDQRREDYRTVEEIADGVGSTPRATRVVLDRLFRRGFLVKGKDDDEDWRWRAKRGRCESVHREGRRSWRCGKEEHSRGMHSSSGGGRTW